MAPRRRRLEVFKGQRFFSVSVLSVEQVDLARRFATRMPDRFDGIAVHEGVDGVPLVDGALAWFECERRTQMLHGDHWLFVGEVKRCAAADGSPLIFRHGEFAIADSLEPQAEVPSRTAPPADASPWAGGPAQPLPASQASQASQAGSDGMLPLGSLEPGDQPFYEEYLPFLLARAGHQVEAGFHRQLQKHDLSMLSWRVLAALSSRSDWTIGELCEASLAKQPTISKLIDRLVQQGMVARRSDATDARRTRIDLTAKGHDTMAPVLQDASAFNLALLADYPPEQLTALKRLLRDMITRYSNG